MKQGNWYLDVHMHTGSVMDHKITSLQAFWPALQARNTPPPPSPQHSTPTTTNNLTLHPKSNRIIDIHTGAEW